ATPRGVRGIARVRGAIARRRLRELTKSERITFVFDEGYRSRRQPIEDVASAGPGAQRAEVRPGRPSLQSQCTVWQAGSPVNRTNALPRGFASLSRAGRAIPPARSDNADQGTVGLISVSDWHRLPGLRCLREEQKRDHADGDDRENAKRVEVRELG